MRAGRSTNRAVDLDGQLFAIATEFRGLGTEEETTRILLGLLALQKVLTAFGADVGSTFGDLARAPDVQLALEHTLKTLRENRDVSPAVVEAVDTLLSGIHIDKRVLTTALHGIVGLPEKLLDPSSLARAAAGLVMQGASRKGELGSPAAGLTKLMLELVDARAGARFADPFCRAGLLLLAAGQRAREQRTPVSGLDGTEPNQVAAAMARVTLFLADLPCDIDVSNVLLSPGRHALARYDAVLTAPPFGVASPPHLHIEGSDRFRFGVPARAADWLFAQHALALLSDDGVAVVLMSRGALFRSGSEENVRQALVDADRIDCVVGLPGGLLPGTTIPCALIVFRLARSKERGGTVTMVDVEEPSKASRRTDLSEDVIASIVAATRGERPVSAGVRARTVNIELLTSNEYSLLPSRYFEPTSTEVLRDLPVIAAELRVAREADAVAARHVASSLAALAAATRIAAEKNGVAS